MNNLLFFMIIIPGQMSHRSRLDCRWSGTGRGRSTGSRMCLGPGVSIEDGAIIPPNTRLMAYQPPPDEFADDDSEFLIVSVLFIYFLTLY